MNLANEAGYLYVLSKELLSLNKLVSKLTAQTEKHRHKYNASKTDDERHNHKLKHARATIELTHLLKKHQELLEKLKHHHLAFDDALRKEHKI